MNSCLDKPLIQKKKQIKEFLTIIHAHPCYLISIYKNNLVQPVELSKIVKEIYSNQNDRINFLLLALCERALEHEISSATNIEDIDFLKPTSVFGKTFRYIFKN